MDNNTVDISDLSNDHPLVAAWRDYRDANRRFHGLAGHYGRGPLAAMSPRPNGIGVDWDAIEAAKRRGERV